VRLHITANILVQCAKHKIMRLYVQDAYRRSRRCDPGWMTKRSTSWWGASLAVFVFCIWQFVFLSSVAMAANNRRRPPQHNQTNKKDAEDYYKILGLKRNCKPKEIKVMPVLLCCLRMYTTASMFFAPLSCVRVLTVHFDFLQHVRELPRHQCFGSPPTENLP
jgi:hypothetical protein